MVVAGVVLGLIVLGVLAVRRWRAGPDPEAAERAVRERQERAAVQDRMTRMHPDFVKDWMRPR